MVFCHARAKFYERKRQTTRPPALNDYCSGRSGAPDRYTEFLVLLLHVLPTLLSKIGARKKHVLYPLRFYECDDWKNPNFGWADGRHREPIICLTKSDHRALSFRFLLLRPQQNNPTMARTKQTYVRIILLFGRQVLFLSSLTAIVSSSTNNHY
jgi:hypothetical protein